MRVALLLLAACGVEGREHEPPPVSTLPAGIWTPDGRASTAGTSLVSDGENVWFAYTIGDATGSEVWVAKVDGDGELLVQPRRIGEGHAPSIDFETNVTLGYAGNHAVRVASLESADGELRHVAELMLDGPLRSVVALARTSDRATLVAANIIDGAETVKAFEVSGGVLEREVVVDEILDRAQVGLVVGGVLDDDSIASAWTRVYDECYSEMPGSTFTATIGDAVSTPRSVADTAGITEGMPAIAAFGRSAYVVWGVDMRVRSTIRLARFSDVSTPLAEIGDPTAINGDVKIALAEEGRGAIAWVDRELDAINVASFVDDGVGVAIGSTHSYPIVLAAPWLNGIVSVGGDRFVIAWSESSSRRGMFARTIDLSEAPRELPPEARVSTSRPRSPRCIH